MSSCYISGKRLEQPLGNIHAQVKLLKHFILTKNCTPELNNNVKLSGNIVAFKGVIIVHDG